MKKLTGFTLMEMLIVIVIIGLLLVFLAPKLLGTQNKARDVGRQTNLRDIAGALMNYQSDEAEYPAEAGSINQIEGLDEYLDYKTPTDPQKNRTIENGEITGEPGQYLYVPLNKRGLDAGGFALVASVETESAANRVANSNTFDGTSPRGTIPVNTNYKSIAKAINACDQIKEGNEDPNCDFDPLSETLRYVYIQ